MMVDVTTQQHYDPATNFSDLCCGMITIHVLFVCLFILYPGSIFRGKFKYPSVLPYGPNNNTDYMSG